MLRPLLTGSSLLALAVTAQIGTASANPIFDLSPGSIAFGNVLVGQSSSRGVTLTNEATPTLQGTFTNPHSPFSGDTEDFSTKSGKTTTDTITFAPTVRGNASGSVGVSGKAGNTTQTGSVAVSGKGVAAVNAVSVGPAPVTRIGTTGTATLTVNNVGDGNLSGMGVASNLQGSVGSASGVFSGTGGAVNLPDGGSKAFSYAFAPTTHAASAANILASFTNGSSDGQNRAQTVTATLQGRGVGPTYASSTTPGGTLDFGKVQAGHTGVLDLVLSNISTDIGPGNLTALSLVGVSLTGPGAAAFSLDKAFVISVLQEGDVFDLKLDFSSPAAGLFDADLVIGTDQNAAFGANGMTFTYHLQGQAVPEPASFAILGAGALMLLAARRRRAGGEAR